MCLEVEPPKLTTKVLYAGPFLYATTIFFTKSSVLCLYRRVFANGTMYRGCTVVGITVLLWYLGVCLVAALICVPARKLWRPSTPGRCVNLAHFCYGLQIPNLLTSSIILIMPLSTIWNLVLPRRQKALLFVAFLLGILFVTFPITSPDL